MPSSPPVAARAAVVQYPSYDDARHGRNPKPLPELADAVQVVAYEVGFAALTRDKTVLTWGDGRYPDCLGRKTSSSYVQLSLSTLGQLCSEK